MQSELKRIQKQVGITFIYITHDQEEAINMSDRIAVMNHGILEQVGTPNEIYYCPKTSYVASFIGNANIWCEGTKTYAIRQEMVLLPGETWPTCVRKQKAVVKDKTFSGGQLRIVFAAENSTNVTAVRSGIDSSLKIGDGVEIAWTCEAMVAVVNNGI